MDPATARLPAAAVDPLFLDRWSPRSFTTEPLEPAAVASLFEAARWSPSCFNAQPWLFVHATSAGGRARILDLLAEANQAWARRAPLLGVVFARRRFEHDGRPNRWGAFDAGAASLSLALQASRLGLAAHFMGGFDAARAAAELGVDSEDFEPMAGFAVGRRGPAELLPAALAAREQPSSRKPLEAIVRELA